MIELRAHALDLLNAAIFTPACKICDGHTVAFDLVDFNKTGHSSKYPYGVAGIPVQYYKCKDCFFIFTDFFDKFTNEQWVNYIYNEEYYVSVDPEYSG